MDRSFWNICTVLASACFATSVAATDLPASPPPAPAPALVANGWTFSIAPYFWAAGLSGDVGQFGLPAVYVDADFSDILSNLDFAAMAMGEARNGRFSLFGDILYTKLSPELSTPRGILADKVGITSETFAGLAAVGYAVWESPQGHLDVVGGMRVWQVSTDLSFRGQILDGRGGSDSASWVDGIVGLRGRYELSDKFYLTGWGLVGAGGADIDWDVGAGVGYAFNDRLSLVLGYRALGVDYDKDDFLFNVVEQGPILGTVIRF